MANTLALRFQTGNIGLVVVRIFALIGLRRYFLPIFASAISFSSELDETEKPMNLVAALLALDTVILIIVVIIFRGTFY